MYKIIAILLCITYVTALEKINNQLINKDVERSIDLTTQLVQIKTTITLENTGKDAVRNFLIVQEPNTIGAVAYLNVKDSLKDELKFSSAKVENESNRTFYNVLLNQPLDAGRTISITVEQVLTRGLVPYPSSIAQKERQLVRYFGNHYFYTPYVTTKQKTEVNINTKTPESYTKLKPVSLVDTSIVYGPYSIVQPYTEDQMIIHYENNAPFLTVTRLERLIEISHWGTIAVEENIEIRHTGAKLKGSFSRYDFQRDSSKSEHCIKSYRTALPASAHSIYYRDSNGNISTSTVIAGNSWLDLELRPRFPLFGGWKSSYTLGYSVPSYQYLYKHRSNSGEYVLIMRLIDHVFDDMFVEELETSIVLPVGVSNIRINTPYEVERLSDEVTYKYLDNIGRTVIKLKKNNLVEQHIQNIEVIYNWTPHLLLHEPILIFIALFLLFIIVIIYVRLDFSLNKLEHSKKD